MWGRRRKRGTRLQRQLALGRLEEAIAQAEQPQEGNAEQSQEGNEEAAAVPYPEGAPAVPSDRAAGLSCSGVPVDNSAGPAADEKTAPQVRDLPAQRTGDSERHGTFG
jgi:hypothetical protein